MIPQLHVAVVNYRTPRLLAACLQSIALHCDVPYVVGVFDSGENNIGYGAALNRIFTRADAPFLLALNADTELPADGVEPLLALFAAHPRLGVLGPRQVTPDGRIAHAGIEHLGDTSGGRGMWQPDTGQFTETFLPVEQVSGSVMLIRRTALEQIGGIPETRLYFEDALLCWRMRQPGWQVGYSGMRTFLHHVAASPQPEGTTRATLAQKAFRQFQQEVAGV